VVFTHKLDKTNIITDHLLVKPGWNLPGGSRIEFTALWTSGCRHAYNGPDHIILDNKINSTLTIALMGKKGGWPSLEVVVAPTSWLKQPSCRMVEQ